MDVTFILVSMLVAAWALAFFAFAELVKAEGGNIR